MGIPAKEAADLVGMSKTSILKAIKTGRLSATKNTDGEWRIEPVELFRVYAPVGSGTQQPSAESVREDTPNKEDNPRLELLYLRERLAEKDETIADLRKRLDAEAEERRRLSYILTAERGTQPIPQAPEALRKPWWARIFG